MNVKTDEEADDCARCPRCQLRERLAVALGDEIGEGRQELLDQLLNTVERLRAVDGAEDYDEAEELVDLAVAEVLAIGDCIDALADGTDGERGETHA